MSVCTFQYEVWLGDTMGFLNEIDVTIRNTSQRRLIISTIVSVFDSKHCQNSLYGQSESYGIPLGPPILHIDRCISSFFIGVAVKMRNTCDISVRLK